VVVIVTATPPPGGVLLVISVIKQVAPAVGVTLPLTNSVLLLAVMVPDALTLIVA
jgi:hypothetical protein